MTTELITADLYPNANKQHEQHPDLKGKLLLNGQTLEIALWTRQTKDRTRIYHSATISEAYRKGETSPALVKGIKLYEFRKRADADPDFQSPDGFELLGKTYSLALWVEVGGKDDLEDLKFRIALLNQPYAVRLTSECQSTLNSLRERMKARSKELEDQKAYAENQAAIRGEIEGDDLTYNEHGEPSNLPF
jgi:hypothetical protein